jgi:hypothetical protein
VQFELWVNVRWIHLRASHRRANRYLKHAAVEQYELLRRTPESGLGAIEKEQLRLAAASRRRVRHLFARRRRDGRVRWDESFSERDGARKISDRVRDVAREFPGPVGGVDLKNGSALRFIYSVLSLPTHPTFRGLLPVADIRSRHGVRPIDQPQSEPLLPVALSVVFFLGLLEAAVSELAPAYEREVRALADHQRNLMTAAT